MSERDFVEYFQNKFDNYHPKIVRRKEIPKPNGKVRPLGIPSIEDRIVQQCIKQILEPICEAKFYDSSYGFRPLRSTENAIAECYRLMQVSHMQYTVDVDIKGFFDNVNHKKLLRQLWAIGIRDTQRATCRRTSRTIIFSVFLMDSNWRMIMNEQNIIHHESSYSAVTI